MLIKSRPARSQKRNENGKRDKGENYKAGMNQANNLAQQRMSAAAQNAQNQMAAQTNTFKEGMSKLNLGAAEGH